jgi:ribosome biogenesis GTPase
MTKSNNPSFWQSLHDARHEQGMEKSARRQKLQAAKKKFKRNQQPKQARRKNWLPDNLDDPDSMDFAQAERVMPRDERDRRRALAQAAFRQTDNAPAGPAATASPVDDLTGLVIEVSQGLCRVEVGSELWLCGLRGTLQAEVSAYTNVVAVGDRVIVRPEGQGRGMVEAILPRRRALARPDVFRSHLQQVIVANVDQLLIVASWRDPIIWLELIDRYLITAARNQLPALICLNKTDLVTDQVAVRQTLRPYQALGIPLLPTSALTGAGIEALRAALQHKTTVLAGLSGVGKSSLLTAIQPELALRTGLVSEHSGEGRHTTTQATLLHLDAHTTVVDTPGIREFGLSGLRQSELVTFFPELATLAAGCRFSNCTHLSEPDCAVRAGLGQGAIAASRYDSYQKIYETLPA